MRVGALRDWELAVYAAVSPAGETGIHFRFRRLKEKFVAFFGCAEIEELSQEVMRVLNEIDTKAAESAEGPQDALLDRFLAAPVEDRGS